jgi:thiol:disulfide interchange protein
MTMMSRAARSAAALGATLALTVGAAAYAGPKHGPIKWVTSWSKAKAMAAKQKKPMMVDFYADWCPPCQAMLKTTWKDKAVVERSKRFIPVLIDIDAYAQIADDAKVSAVPTVVFYSPSARELLRADGYRDAKAMLDLMAQAEKRAKP